MCSNEITKLRVAIIGLGGVGGYLAASLNKTPHEIVCFARGEHLKVIQKSGIEIVEDGKSWNASLNANELSHASGYFDIVLFCVKSYDLKSSYEAIEHTVDNKSTLISFSNGVSNGEVLRELSEAIVLDGCMYILSHIEKAGVIRKKGKVFAAVFGGEEKSTQRLKMIFDEAGLRNKTPLEIKTAIWKKYIFISAFATMTSFYDKSIGYVYENHLDEAKKLLEEIAQVAFSMNIDIREEVAKALETASKVPYDSSTSMHLDFTNKKRDELETLSAYIVKQAQKEKVEVPLMCMMYEELLKRHID